MINISRGEIIDTNALIEGIENEQEVIHIDHNYNVIKNRDLLILKAYLNVIVTRMKTFTRSKYLMIWCIVLWKD